MSEFGRTLFSVDVRETDKNRDYWASRPWISSEQGAARSADILIVPWENFREMDALFPDGTTEFYKLLKKKTDKTVSVAIDRDKFHEVALHANEWRLPTLLVGGILLPIISDVLADQVKQWMTTPSSGDTVEMQLIVERKSGPCISLRYKGPPDKLVPTILDQTRKCLNDRDLEED